MINKVINLWEKDFCGFMPTVTTYVIDDPMQNNRQRPAVLICPGGGYSCCSPREGEPIALQFNANGFHAFVVEYNTKNSNSQMSHPQPLLDISRAMCIIRENAKQWCVIEDKIAVCGFSAGGHAAASLATLWNRDYVQNAKGIKKEQNKPNALILSYPVITSGEYAHKGSIENLIGTNCSEALLDEVSLEKQVSKDTPETFIWHTYDDAVVPLENTLMFAYALRKEKIPFEMHVYPEGKHGLSLANSDVYLDSTFINPHAATWMMLCCQWLKNTFA